MNVQGRQCSECVDGFYGLELTNPNGCSGGEEGGKEGGKEGGREEGKESEGEEREVWGEGDRGRKGEREEGEERGRCGREKEKEKGGVEGGGGEGGCTRCCVVWLAVCQPSHSSALALVWL